MAAVLKWEMGAELPRNSLSVAKEGKVFEQKKLLQPLLGTPEGTKMTGTIFFLTSPTLTVYSNEDSFSFILHVLLLLEGERHLWNCF